MENKYLCLSTNWVIRGTKEIPRLFNTFTNKIVPLNNDILKYILLCDGQHTIKNIYEFDKSNKKTDIIAFYQQFIDEGIIQLLNTKNKIIIDSSLGPKEPWLKEIHLDITNNCDLRCKHCFWGSNLKNDINSPIQNWERLLYDAKKCGCAKIVISGGEAFTNNDLLKIIIKANELNFMISSIFTNGTISNKLTHSVIDYLIEKKLSTIFYISLDGCNAAQHDFIRGTGNFDKTMNFIKLLNKRKKQENANYKIMINSLIHKKNYKSLIEWYDFLNDNDIYGWRFTTGRITGFFKKNENEIKISSKECFDEYKKLINYIIRKYNNKENILYINIENFFTTRSLINKVMYIFDENLSICDYKKNACSIDPKGNVQFCTGWQSKKYGNAFNDDIKDIWYSKQLQEIKQMKIRDIKECKKCKYLKFCGGGCRLECKDIYSKDEAICENFEIFEKEIIPILNENKIVFRVE